jgi:lipopolysaccharide export system permease protein
MKKFIFKKLYRDTTYFFLTSLLVMGLIVWTLQAVNYFDFVTEDGHGLRVYFSYTLLNFPKIINRILPFIFFISLFYVIINYELRNELSIFWINGISKIKFLNKLIIFSIYLMIFQILLGSYLSPLSQFKGREYLKNSNVDFFTSLIKEGKFINITKNITIFIDKENQDGSFNNIFLEDLRNNSSKMIYAKKGVLIIDGAQKTLKLINGRVINNKNLKVNIFDFDQIDFNLNNLSSKTITVPKIQEIDTYTLINCFSDNLKNEKKEFHFICEKKLKPEILRELFKRIYKPIFLPIITLFCGFLIIKNKNNINFKKNNFSIFILTTFLIIFSEISMRYIASSNFLTMLYILIPIVIFTISYYIFYKFAKHV